MFSNDFKEVLNDTIVFTYRLTIVNMVTGNVK